MITTNLKTVARRWHELPVPVAITICVFCLITIAALLGKIHTSQQAAAVPTPALDPIIIIATPRTDPLPTPAAVVAVELPRFVVCYDQPLNGAVLGPIPAPDASAVVARYGVAWVMTPWNGGYCWLHAADVGLPDVADLAPVPQVQPQVVYVASQPQAPDEPTSAPQEAQPAAAPAVWATSGPIRKEDFQEPNRAATCAFVGCLQR